MAVMTFPAKSKMRRHYCAVRLLGSADKYSIENDFWSTLRSGRDDKFVVQEELSSRLKVMKNAFYSATALHGSASLPFVIPSAAEGSAVPRTTPGNFF
jgi:hypothetical protein